MKRNLHMFIGFWGLLFSGILILAGCQTAAQPASTPVASASPTSAAMPTVAATATTATAAATPTNASASASPTTSAAGGTSTPRGEVLFRNQPGNCAMCHGQNGQGGAQGAPKISGTGRTFEQVLNKVRSGGRAMPAFPASQISDADVREIYEWLRSQP